jgi:serine/threonine protein kinase
MAPERIDGEKGDAPCDVYSLGCMLFEAVTGHVPFDRPTDVSKLFAHVNDPIPCARDEVDGVPEVLDEIIAKSMSKRPEDRFESAELTTALGRTLLELETGERTIVSRTPEIEASPEAPTELSTPPTEPSEPPAGISEPTTTVAELSGTVDERATTRRPMAATPAQTIRPPAGPRSRRSRILWVVPIALLLVAGGLVAVLSGGNNAGPSAKGGQHQARVGQIQIHGSGLAKGRTISLPAPPGSISLGTRNLWISLPSRNELVRANLSTGAQQAFPAAGSPTAIAAGFSALWVAQRGSRVLDQFDGDSGARVHFAKLAGAPEGGRQGQQPQKR